MINRASRMDWQINRSAFWALLAVIGAGCALLWVLAEQVEDLRLQEHQVRIKMDQAAQRLQTARENYDYVKAFYEQYRHLVSGGIVAPEDRLQWIDAVRAVAETIKIPHMDYQLNPQREYVLATSNTAPSGVRIFFSSMYLKLSLLHEGDLIAFMTRLEEQAKGLFDIDFCKLERRSEKLVYQPEATNISATCDIRWYTLRGAS